MTSQQLIRVQLPGGRVGVSTCSRLPEMENVSTHATDRVVLLADPHRHPIAWMWSKHPQLAACLPDAFECVMIDLKQLPSDVQDDASLRKQVHSLHSFELTANLVDMEPAEFLPTLAPRHQQADASLRSAVHGVSAGLDRTASNSVQGGLFLMNDCLDESHACSQSIEGEGQNGDYWHAIMHRREPDYGNAKYWFRQVGRHPVFERLSAIAARVVGERKVDGLDRLASGEWDPFLFVDLCERYARNEDSPAALALREIQGWEMALLLDASAHE